MAGKAKAADQAGADQAAGRTAPKVKEEAPAKGKGKGKGKGKAKVEIKDEEESESDSVFGVESIKAHKYVTVRGRKVIRYKIRWGGFGPEEDTWEPAANLKGCRETLDAYKQKHGL